MQLISAIIVVVALAMPIFKENMAIRNVGKNFNWDKFRKEKIGDEIVEEKITRKEIAEVGGGLNA